MIRLVLVPDRYAHYRQGIFEELSRSYDVTLFASHVTDASNIHLAKEGVFKKNINWFGTRDFFLGDACVWQFGFFKAILWGHYDIAIFWGDASRVSTWLASIVAKIRGRKVIFWTHGLYGNESKVKLRVRLIFYAIADHVFTYGQFARSLLLGHGFNRERVTAVSNSLPVGMIESASSLLGAPLCERTNKKISVCFVGRLTKGKSLEMLIDLASQFKENDSRQFEVQLVGGGPLLEELQLRAINKNVGERIIFHGAEYDFRKISKIVSECVCCVSPGNVGLTAITSLSLGVPVITHADPLYQMPEYESVVEGLSGRLFARGNLGDLTLKMAQLLEDISAKKITQATCLSVVEGEYTVDKQILKIRSSLAHLIKKT
jgi:glycosyltransferase involved in cell wall biosynthesis